MKNLSIAAAILSLLVVSTAHGAEYYPKQISLRTFGIDQGDVGDCQTAAEISALESGFANRGRDFVKLSLFYRHAANWAGKTGNEGTKLNLDADDLAFIQKAGPLLPDFMWPEDGEGYDPAATGDRPHPAQAVVWDSEFPSAASMGFAVNFYSFKPGYSNSSNLDGLKANVSAGNAVVLSLHGDLFQPGSSKIQWDHVTGFLKTPYSWANLMERLTAGSLNAETGIDHAMWVVGFDDSLYADQGYSVPGALIVRNSWNNSDEVAASLAHPNEYQTLALAKMRLKVFSQNLPGFYAIPYQYVLDMLANRTGGFEVLNLNFEAFAAKYAALSSRYRVERLPYVCDTDLPSNRHLSDPVKRAVTGFGVAYQTLNDPQVSDQKRADASRVTYQAALKEVQSRNIDHGFGKRPLFRYARLSSHAGLKIDRADDFYTGKFLNYYCPDMSGVWPGVAPLANPDVREALGALGEGGSSFGNWYAYLRALSAAGI
ncbi:MAG: hypothetical protein ACXVCI_04195 [Bdellovibrionota bacterium]